MHWRKFDYIVMRDDWRFLSALLERIDCKALMMAHYDAAFLDAYTSEQDEHRKENAARFAANNRIRIMVKNYVTTGLKPEPITPPRICGNCRHLQLSGVCKAFNQYVPKEYVDVETDCKRYINEVPF